MPLLLKALTLLICWAALVIGLARTFSGRRTALAAGCCLGLIIGTLGSFFLFSSFSGEIPFVIIKAVLSVAFICLFVAAAFAWHQVPASSGNVSSPSLTSSSAVAGLTAFLAATVYAVLVVCRVPYSADNAAVLAWIFILLAVLEFWLLVYRLEPLLPPIIAMAKGELPLLVVSLLLFIASFSPRLDLFSPLSMKVMKLIHDAIHQFFESLLIPDHPFFRTDIWNYIGMLFSNSVGFWGGSPFGLSPQHG